MFKLFLDLYNFRSINTRNDNLNLLVASFANHDLFNTAGIDSADDLGDQIAHLDVLRVDLDLERDHDIVVIGLTRCFIKYLEYRAKLDQIQSFNFRDDLVTRVAWHPHVDTILAAFRNDNVLVLGGINLVADMPHDGGLIIVESHLIDKPDVVGVLVGANQGKLCVILIELERFDRALDV